MKKPGKAVVALAWSDLHAVALGNVRRLSRDNRLEALPGATHSEHLPSHGSLRPSQTQEGRVERYLFQQTYGARLKDRWRKNEPAVAFALKSDDQRDGCRLPTSWISRQWDPEVRTRFRALLAALADPFDGRISGVILTAAAVTVDRDTPPEGRDCDRYFGGRDQDALFARQAFTRSHVVQYVNFWPCGWANARRYMSRFSSWP